MGRHYESRCTVENTEAWEGKRLDPRSPSWPGNRTGTPILSFRVLEAHQERPGDSSVNFSILQRDPSSQEGGGSPGGAQSCLEEVASAEEQRADSAVGDQRKGGKLLGSGGQKRLWGIFM